MWQRVILAAMFCLPLLYLAMAPMISGSLPVPTFLDMNTHPLNYALAQVVLLLPILGRAPVLCFRHPGRAPPTWTPW